MEAHLRTEWNGCPKPHLSQFALLYVFFLQASVASRAAVGGRGVFPTPALSARYSAYTTNESFITLKETFPVDFVGQTAQNQIIEYLSSKASTENLQESGSYFFNKQ